MSGTSADGIDVALVRVAGRGFNLRFELLGHLHSAYPRPVRQAVLQRMNAGQVSVADLSRLNFLLGELYAEAVGKVQKRFRIIPDLVGCHGQTIYHQGAAATFLGKRIACTWQLGEGAVIAKRLGIPVVSDFRPADMAAGGKGAPLVPFLDYAVFRDRRMGRIVQNIGGIANLTAIPAAARPEDVIAFDTGPGNMVIDQLMQHLYGKPYDRDGRVAQEGNVLQPLLEELLRNHYFSSRPPKTAGREEFGREYAQGLLRRRGRASKADLIATATALTAQSIARAIKRFVLLRAPDRDFSGAHERHLPHTTERDFPRPRERGLSHGSYRECIVSGGGSKNRTLMGMLAEATSRLGLTLRRSDEFGVPSQAKEAVAFALLAYQTWHRQPGNIPAATGAKSPAVLGKISYVGSHSDV
jgi:anhydro-N-acetylmuramic acid kinase